MVNVLTTPKNTNVKTIFAKGDIVRIMETRPLSAVFRLKKLLKAVII